ncbi:MAG: Smr/MutS family protein [Candidatus Binatia bacterium]|nr:Smr/MutS family protein [Candidatus Binatia bacterium]
MSRRENKSTMVPRNAATFAYRPFSVLKDLAAALAVSDGPKKRLAQPQPAEREASSGKGESSLSDLELFWREMAGVRRLWPEGTNLVERRGPTRVPRALTSEDAEVLAELADLVAGLAAFDVTLSDEYVEGIAGGLDLRLLQRLRRGEFAYQDYVDLHGLNVEQAKAKVEEFLSAAVRTGKRCVLIVHGRGKNSKDQVPVLKSRVTEWLARGRWSRMVLAFCSARPCDGGTGALYVLLRRRPRERGRVRVATGVKW